jgi:DNA-directed RNA polymerase specialized sigma24 family protein
MSGLARDAAALDSSVAMAATGDRNAFARLVDAYYADTMRVAFVVAGGDREVAKDAVQAAWSIAWQKTMPALAAWQGSCQKSPACSWSRGRLTPI